MPLHRNDVAKSSAPHKNKNLCRALPPLLRSILGKHFATVNPWDRSSLDIRYLSLALIAARAVTALQGHPCFNFLTIFNKFLAIRCQPAFAKNTMDSSARLSPSNREPEHIRTTASTPLRACSTRRKRRWTTLCTKASNWPCAAKCCQLYMPPTRGIPFSSLCTAARGTAAFGARSLPRPAHRQLPRATALRPGTHRSLV